jgi:hypothetical protein
VSGGEVVGRNLPTSRPKSHYQDQDLSRFIKIYQDLSRFIKIYQDLTRFINIYQHLSTFINIY